MIAQEIQDKVWELASKPVVLGGWLGLSYQDTNCVKFAVMVYKEMGIEVTEEAIKEARRFRKVDEAQFGDIAVFHGFMLEEFHLAVMLDYRRAIQSVANTNGVGKVDISREPWVSNWRGFYRHESCF